MAKKQTLFICQSCSYQTSQWLGKCPDCGEWNSLTEETKIPNKNSAAISESKNAPKLLNQVELTSERRTLTGIQEFDRVVGGGLVTGSLILVGGEPGIGKSTLLMNVSGALSKNQSQHKILYISGEESETQVADRAKRLGINENNFYFCNETNWQSIQEHLKKLKPKFLILDSIQTISSGEIMSPPGTVSQIREVTYQVMNYAKAYGVTCFVIGHVTKEGNIAGPKILEHMVDTVIYFEGDQFGQYRILRAIKNRYGNTNEVGIFEMKEFGLEEVSNPSLYFLDPLTEGSYGRSLTCIVEGTRSLLVEIQALVVENKYGTGRRTTQGIDTNRLAMMVAVIEKYMGMPLGFNDIYVNIVGGLKLQQRDSDLSVVASLLSSYLAQPIDSSFVFVGEVGLTGEVRSVPLMENRIKELAQLGHRTLVTSLKTKESFKGKSSINIIGVKRIKELQDLVFKNKYSIPTKSSSARL